MPSKINRFLLSIEISIFPPIARISPYTTVRLSERLELSTFFRKSGRPRLYMIDRIRGRADSLHGRPDTGAYIFFPPPKPDFRKMLSLDTYSKPEDFLGYRWIWLPRKGEMALLAMDDFSFYLRVDEARTLERLLFSSEE
ncbi:hypothetical protein [Neogemmobacter tilapiae]|uniref:hypothetical protein n=1 Tax=Neogemmobacter tilapiae TaxID=875041 RepID=UPI00167570FD|nr:hypothetical protein [Gemmobacter tilapiae]